jgi:hypothetical protein
MEDISIGRTFGFSQNAGKNVVKTEIMAINYTIQHLKMVAIEACKE